MYMLGNGAGSAVAQSDHLVRPQLGRPAQSSDVARVVRGAGGHLSPELDVPKLMLLKETYAAWMELVGLALELIDLLTFKCISALERSMNSLSCKFLYQPPLAGPG